MPLSESDARSKLIDPALYARGWKEDFIKREETAGAVEVQDGKPRRRSHGRTDYILRLRVIPDAQPVAVALIEAKAESLPPEHGLEQAKVYAASKRLDVPFVFVTNDISLSCSMHSQPRRVSHAHCPSSRRRKSFAPGMRSVWDSRSRRKLPNHIRQTGTDAD